MRRSPALAVLLAVLLTGCTAGGSSDSAAPASAEGGAALDAAPPDAGADQAPVLGRVAPAPAVIRTAELSVQVKDVRGAADEAARLARGAAGSVEAEERSGTGDDASAVVVVRVPPAAFDALLGRFAALGEEQDRRLGTEDVTDQVVDLDSRIATQRASVARVRELLDRAGTLGEVVQVEGELTKRTADLEALEARLAALEKRVDLSTVTLRLTRSDDASVGGALGFGDGLRAGWDALQAVGRAVGVTAGAVLPFLPLLLLVGFFGWKRAHRTAAA